MDRTRPVAKARSGLGTWRRRARSRLLYRLVPPVAGNGPLIEPALGLSSAMAIVVGTCSTARGYAGLDAVPVGQFLFFLGDVYTYSYPSCWAARCRSRRWATPSTCRSTRR